MERRRFLQVTGFLFITQLVSFPHEGAQIALIDVTEPERGWLSIPWGVAPDVQRYTVLLPMVIHGE